MREIKFRAWDKVSKMYYSGDYDFHFTKSWYVQEKEKPWEMNVLVSSTTGILMQYTGLKDKNGKEAYFGDLIKLWEDRKVVYEIRWGSIMGRIFLHHLDKNGDSGYQYGSDIQEGKIVGNIYENPELLKEKP